MIAVIPKERLVRNKLNVMMVVILILFVTTLPLGCVRDGQGLAALLKKIDKNRNELASEQKKVDNLAIKVRFNPDKPNKMEDLYQDHLEIGFRLQEQQGINSKIIKDYKKAKGLTDDKKELRYLEKAINAYESRANNIEASRKIQSVYIQIWHSMTENKEVLSKSEYQSLRKVLVTNLLIQEKSENKFQKLEKDADKLNTDS